MQNNHLVPGLGMTVPELQSTIQEWHRVKKMNKKLVEALAVAYPYVAIDDEGEDRTGEKTKEIIKYIFDILHEAQGTE